MPARPPLAVCYGTRPQVIKASRLVDVLESEWPLLTMDTGQHYDYELNGLLYEQLGVRRPQVLLGVGSSDHATQTSAVLSGAAAVFGEHRPWAVLVIGDTNSTLGCALAAAKLRIPVVHVEAGLRADDLMMAEELNRRMVDAISRVLCAPSAAAEARLRSESPGGHIVFTGDVAHDVLRLNVPRAVDGSGIPDWPLTPGEPFVFATLHRAELTDDEKALRGVLAGLGALGLPVVMAAHPRTANVLERSGALRSLSGRIHVRRPLGYFETLGCVRSARLVVTDSGGVQREAYWLGTPCVTVRRETEWHETITLGANHLVDPIQAETQLPRVASTFVAPRTGNTSWDRTAYGDGNAALVIASSIRALAAEVLS